MENKIKLKKLTKNENILRWKKFQIEGKYKIYKLFIVAGILLNIYLFLKMSNNEFKKIVGYIYLLFSYFLCHNVFYI